MTTPTLINAEIVGTPVTLTWYLCAFRYGYGAGEQWFNSCGVPRSTPEEAVADTRKIYSLTQGAPIIVYKVELPI